MKKAIFAFVLLAMFASSFARASEMKRACVDSKGGAYIAASDDSMKCANGGCSLPNGTNLSGLYEEGKLSQLGEAEMRIASDLGISLNAALGGLKNPNPENEPKLYFAPKLSIFCTSDIDSEDFESANVAENLSQLK